MNSVMVWSFEAERLAGDPELAFDGSLRSPYCGQVVLRRG